MCIAHNREMMIGSAVTHVRTAEMISRSAKRGSSRIGTRTIGSISRWITFKTGLDNATLALLATSFLGEDVVWWSSRWKTASAQERGREQARRASRNDEDGWIERVRSALLPFVEKGRRNYVVAQLMRPRGTIIW